jgi:SAM-dependent methyltransferase
VRALSSSAVGAWTKVAAWRRTRAAPAFQPSSPGGRPISSDQEALLERYAPGQSFADIGCMWRIDGYVAFRAEELGATSVCAFDAMEPTESFLRHVAERSSKVRFVRGDAHLSTSAAPTEDADPRFTSAGIDAVGEHDVVWCSGVLYHTPDPHLLVRNLLSITRHRLILGTKTIPEIPGVPGGAVFYPAVPEAARSGFAAVAPGAVAPFDRTPWREYANWWWGFSPSALRGLVESVSGWRVEDQVLSPWTGADDNCHLLIVPR